VLSKRRSINEIVVLSDDEDGSYYGRVDALGAERNDECPHCRLEPKHDPHCKEWPNVEILDTERKPTGKYVHHVAECRMSDPD